ncbi:enoyl-CoA hydratase/isomerase family protein [Candidiatus Paracoxiella cheracis]|uniref:enoyl-CoA hydratase/isomerase family protein n=1 Tax=Candidiatus Paracoxiella cheracis TaxID=3405120 RepID=UPI003BF476EC
MSENHSQDIIFHELRGNGGSVGHILLNRPKALNSLTASMCKLLHDQLVQWQQDSNIKAVVIRGDGDRAFCAGGDIRRIYHNGEKNIADSTAFFRDEYRMNAAIFHFNKPYVSLLDGITMGGGAGVSVHGSHRVATERLMFAMPETGIGFFPDIGAGYFLTHCPDKLGYYLGLTGDRIGAADAQELGLVTHVIASDEQENLIQALMDNSFNGSDFAMVSRIIEDFVIKTKPPRLINHFSQISECFDGKTVEDILTRLEEVNSEWSLLTTKTLQSKSPTSLKVTLEQLNRAQGMKFDDIMKMEFNIALQFLRESDFYEGVRAVVIDKDQKPAWQPNKLELVTSEIVDQFFVNRDDSGAPQIA